MLLSEYLYCLAMAFKMTEWVEQRICNKFCVKLEHSSTETIWMIQKVFRDNTMSAIQIKLWHKCFKDGRESVESNPCPGRPATSRTPENIECVQDAINKDQWLTVWELEADLEIPKLLCARFWCMKHVVVNLFCCFYQQSRRNIVLQLLMTWFKPLPINQISLRRS